MKRQKSVGVDAHIDQKNNGITLIALVVTIIVLLILAGISLNLINGGDGIIIQARWSEFVAEYTKLDEQKELYVAGKQMDKLSEEFSKANWRSLFTNISYALDAPETMYPVDLNQPFSIWEAADTLQATICYVEKLSYVQLHDPAKVDLYRVDMSLLPNVEVRREYVINIASGMLYYIDGEPYKGLIYHTLKYGVPKDPEFPIPPPSEDDLTIHYLSGFDDQEETQTVPFSQSNSVTLNPNPFARSGYNFQYWKEIQLDASGNPQMGTYTGIVHPDNATGVCMNGQDLWLEADWTSDPMNEITLDANGGIFDEDDVKDKLFGYQMSDAERVKFNKKEGDTFGSELLIKPIYTAPDGADYQFEGWFTEKTGGTIKVVGDVYHQSELPKNTLYAHWKKIPDTPTPSGKDLTIHYLSGGAEFDYFEPSYTQLVPAAQTALATLDACRFTGPEGCTFLGWRNALKASASAPYQHGGYYDVANLLIKIFDVGWQEDILDIIESYEDWEADDSEIDDGSEPEPTMEEERRAEILDYFSGEESAIQNLFSNSNMSLNGLADWFVANQGYLATLQAYEESLDEDDDEEELTVDYYDQQSGINMNGTDLWLEALWTDEYTITLDATGGDLGGGLDIMTTTIQVNDNYGTILTTPTKTGSVFEGWFTAPTGGTQITGGMLFQPTDPRILYAHWSVDGVDITYDANTGMLTDDAGNIVNTLTEAKVRGALFGTMPEPFKIGYVFKGWFTQSTGGTLVQESDVVTGPMTLYAQWEEGKFVKLDVQGGEIYRSGYGKAIGLYKKWEPAQIWKSSGKQYSGITPAEGMPIGQQARGPYTCWGTRGWKLPTGSCKYWYTAGGTAYRGVRKKMYGTKLNGKSYKKKVKFVGWYSQPNGQGNLVGPKDIWHDNVLEPGDRTLYAAWQESVTITYNANDGHFGKNVNNTIKQKYNQYEGKKYPRIAKPKMRGYKFVGWYDAPVGGNKIELGKKTCLISKDKVNLYAHWEIKQFKVKFCQNPVSTDPTYKMVTYNTPYGAFPTPVRTGYRFDGWFTKHSGGTQVNSTDIYTRVKNQTLHAHWTVQEFTVTFNATGGSVGTASKKVTYNKAYGTLPTPTRNGYRFDGWFTAASGGTQVTNTTTYNLLSDQMLYAHWTEISFSVNIPESSVGNKGWTQGTIGDITGFSVTYHISTVGPGSSSTTDTTLPNVNGKDEGTTYYVWATATKGSNSVRSRNYVIVQTSHTHTGSPDTKANGCYKTGTSCTKSSMSIKFSSGRLVTDSYNGKRSCICCGSTIAKNVTHYMSQSGGATETLSCNECGTFISYTQNSGGHGRMCVSCYNACTWDSSGKGTTTTKIWTGLHDQGPNRVSTTELES